jgi:hypothetical protein
MRFFRKKPEPADPFAAFSEKFGARAPRTEHAEPESEPKPESVELGTWAHQRLGVSPDASSKERSARPTGDSLGSTIPTRWPIWNLR